MRTVLGLLSLASLLGACTREPEAESAPVAAPAAEEPAAAPIAQAPPTFAAAPRMGGAVVATGDYAVEVVASADGNVDAAVTTATGEAVANADVAELQVTAQGEGEARLPIALRWDAARARFHGAAAAGAHVTSGPLDVACSIRGKAHKGRLNLLVALPRPRLGGRMLALGRYSAEVVPKVDGEVDVHLKDAAGASITTDAALNLHARATTKAAAMQALAFRWDAPRSCFTAKLEGDAALAPGPFELAASVAGDAELKGGVEAIALVPPPSLGGTIIATGDYTVELAPQVDGQLDAVVHDAAGASVEGGVELEAQVQASGKLHPVKLVWDPALLRFRGKLEGDLKLEPGPIELAVVAQGRLRTGAIMAAVVMPKLALDAKAKGKLAANVDAKLDAKAKAKVPTLKGKAGADANAKLSANLPKPNVNVKTGAAADAKATGAAKAGTTGSAAAKASGKGGVKLGGSLGGGLSIGTK
jgi:uncharacterized protein YgiM (DUF1202 family)